MKVGCSICTSILLVTEAAGAAEDRCSCAGGVWARLVHWSSRSSMAQALPKLKPRAVIGVTGGRYRVGGWLVQRLEGWGLAAVAAVALAVGLAVAVGLVSWG